MKNSWDASSVIFKQHSSLIKFNVGYTCNHTNMHGKILNGSEMRTVVVQHTGCWFSVLRAVNMNLALTFRCGKG